MLNRNIETAPPSYSDAVKDSAPTVMKDAQPTVQNVVALSDVKLDEPAKAATLSSLQPSKPAMNSQQIFQAIAAPVKTPAAAPQQQDMDKSSSLKVDCSEAGSCIKDLATVGAAAGCTITIAPPLLLCIGACFGKDNIVSNLTNCLAVLTGCGAATACAATCSTVGMFAAPCVSASGEPDCLKEIGAGIRKQFC